MIDCLLLSSATHFCIVDYLSPGDPFAGVSLDAIAILWPDTVSSGKCAGGFNKSCRRGLARVLCREKGQCAAPSRSTTLKLRRCRSQRFKVRSRNRTNRRRGFDTS